MQDASSYAVSELEALASGIRHPKSRGIRLEPLAPLKSDT